MPDMAFDFSAFPEQENPAPLKVMAFDFSAFPEDQNRVSPKEMPFDFSIFPEQPRPQTVSYAGEDQGSQLSSYDPDSWINDKIPAAPAQPLFASVPRPPERLYRENAPQILQDIWNAASPEPTVGPLREHSLRPDVRQPLWTLFKEQALPNEPTGLIESSNVGLARGAAKAMSELLSWLYSSAWGPVIAQEDDTRKELPSREETYNAFHDSIANVTGLRNLAPPKDSADALAEGLSERAGQFALEAYLLDSVLGKFANLVGEGLASKVPTLAKVGGVAEESAAARANFNVYEALSEQRITGLSRSAHSVSANNALYGQLRSSPELAQMFDEQLGGDVLAHMESGSGGNLLNPPGTIWHHPIDNRNVLQLLRTTEHTNPVLQPLLHPGGIGGYVSFYGN